MRASVIICTYNRSELLRDSIISVQAQDFPVEQFEIVVVDNNSTDGTANVVREIATVSSVKIKYIFEGKQGLSCARNTGIMASIGEIVVFTDDDIDADPHWLSEIIAAFDGDEVACVGGPIKPIWPFEKPQWLSEKWQVYLGVYDYAEAIESRELRGPCYPCGVNVAFRRSIFSEVGMFSTALGRVGDSLLSNEESRICYAIEKNGKRIRFAPQAVIYHKISARRLTKQWFYRRMYWQGRSDAILEDSFDENIFSKAINYLQEMRTNRNVIEINRFDYKCTNRQMKGYILQAIISSTGKSNFKIIRFYSQIINILSETSNSNNIDKLVPDSTLQQNTTKVTEVGLIKSHKLISVVKKIWGKYTF